ncbi:MAG: OB-fold nucleic acid binding domain-containing protein, partial [Nitriliruptor sp.]
MSDAPRDPSDEALPDEGSKLDELIAARRAKVDQLREAGVEPYAFAFRPTDTLAEVAERHPALEPGTETGEQVTVAGRVVAKRSMGRLHFLVLQEADAQLQLFVPIKAVDEPSRDLLGQLDVGDWLGATGEVLATKTGELSVKPSQLTLLAKSLRPLPDKWHGLTDTEARFRQRELDLVVNADARRVFTVRAKVLKALRAELDERGFVEVETPMLHPIPGG